MSESGYISTTHKSHVTSQKEGNTCSCKVSSIVCSYNMPYKMISSTVKQFELDAEAQQKCIEIGGDVIYNISDHLITVSNRVVSDKPNGSFLISTYSESGGITGPLPKITDEECLNNKFKSPVDATVSLSKCFGCGICDELLEIEKEFYEHCSGHGFSPPDDLFADLF